MALKLNDLRTISILLTPVWLALFWWWSAWSGDLSDSAPREPDAQTGEIWKIELRGPDAIFVTQQDYILYWAPWAAMFAAAITFLVLIPLFVRLLRPRLWREATEHARSASSER